MTKIFKIGGEIMSQKVIFKYGNESDIPAAKEAGQLLFAIKSDGTGNIYFDKDASTRIKMGLGTEGGTINGTLLFQNAKKEGHLKLFRAQIILIIGKWMLEIITNYVYTAMI